jgi:predicted DNA-binding transcriptional regulator AlpA
MCTDSTFAASSLACEFLTVEQMAERLKVSRATLFSWMKRGILAQGRHFFKRGRVLRFIWSEELIQGLLQDSGEGAEKCLPVKPSAVPIHKEKASPINWGY